MGFYNDNKPVAATPAVPHTGAVINPTVAETFAKPDDTLTNTKYVIDTMQNRTGVNALRSANVVADLKGFAEGSSIIVTYYKCNYSETDIKGTQIDEAYDIDTAHQALLKINFFELRLLSSLSYEHDAEGATSSLKGEAVTYPGFRPEHGDRFIMEVDTGKYGLMQVINHPTRMSIRASTYYRIEFAQVDWVSTEIEEMLKSQTTDEAWFDKSRFLCEPGALLYHDEYVELKFLTKKRRQMINFIKAKFFDSVLMYSYMRPDDIYDPYAVDFMLVTIPYDEAEYYATQLFEGAPYMDCSIWRALLDDGIPLEVVPTGSKKYQHTLGSKSTLTNSLINKYYIAFVKSDSLRKLLDSIKEATSGSSTEDTEDEGDESTPDLEGTEDEEQTVGDLLLHYHPHYCECPLAMDDTYTAFDPNGPLAIILGYSTGTTLSNHAKLMIEFLETRKIDVNLLHSCIEEVFTLSEIYQFYRMPIYIYLAHVVMGYIHHSEGIYE